jgi:tetratricopeptide (TPR) repeat protein
VSAGRPDGDRDVIPRWRSPHHIATRSEHDPLKRLSESPYRDNRTREQEWMRERTLGFALDLVGSAVILGASQAAKDAAKFILASNQTSPLARLAAERVITGGMSTEFSPLPDPSTSEARERIRDLKRRLTCDPRNALGWTEIARYYTILGQRPKAAIAMGIALRLAPNHRYVLRAATRLAVHHGEFARAHALVRDASRTPTDPWLIATELATAGPAEVPPRYMRQARRMLGAGDFDHRSLTELSSAVGTLELRSGATRKARRFIESSLREPNDNAIAQGQWLSRQLPSVEIGDRLLEESAEARALRHGAAMESLQALEAAWDWHHDQPFASGPGELGSYHASVAERFAEGVDIAKAALLANPREFLLSNNLAFCLLKMDRVSEATKILDGIDPASLDKDQISTYLATAGLLHFRTGDADGGRELYRRAIAQSPPGNHQQLAKINLAAEEYQSGALSKAWALVRELLVANADTKDPEVREWLKRLPQPR